VAVPHVQRAEVDLPPAAAGALEQRVPLPQHPVVVGTHTGIARVPQHQQVVEEPPPLGRVALDHREVLGCEEHRAQDAEDLPRTWDR
jgi:hypothetical protein